MVSRSLQFRHQGMKFRARVGVRAAMEMRAPSAAKQDCRPSRIKLFSGCSRATAARQKEVKKRKKLRILYSCANAAETPKANGDARIAEIFSYVESAASSCILSESTQSTK